MNHLQTIFLTILLLFAGAETLFAQSAPRPRFEPMGESDREMKPKKKNASIFQRRKRARPPLQKHTLIQVLVVERTTAQGNSREDSTARASANLEIASYLKFKDGNLASGTNPLELDVEADKRRQIRDQNQRSINIQTRIAARITDVLPNGNLRIEARTERRINEELTVMTLTGELPSDAIDADLVAQSDRIADLKLNYSAANPRTKKTRKTIVERVLLFLWPF